MGKKKDPGERVPPQTPKEREQFEKEVKESLSWCSDCGSWYNNRQLHRC